MKYGWRNVSCGILFVLWPFIFSAGLQPSCREGVTDYIIVAVSEPKLHLADAGALIHSP